MPYNAEKNIDILEKLPYTDFSIENMAELIKAFNGLKENISGDEIENNRERLAKSQFLLERFLLKLNVDPKFYYFVLKEIVQIDYEIFVSAIKKEINGIYNELIPEEREIVFPIYPRAKELSLSEKKFRVKLIPIPQNLELDGIKEMFEHNVDEIIKYLEEKLKETDKHENPEMYLAIKYTLYQFKKGGIISINHLFKPILPYWYLIKKPPQWYHLVGVSFYCRNVEPIWSVFQRKEISQAYLTSIYESSKRSGLIINWTLIYGFIEKYLDNLIDIHNYEDFANKLKFISDAISIASVIWFNNLSLEKRAELLRRDFSDVSIYEFSDNLDRKEIETYLILFNNAVELKEWDIAREIGELLLKNKKKMNDVELFSVYGGMGVVYREIKEHEKSLEIFEKLIEHIKSMKESPLPNGKKKMYHIFVYKVRMLETYLFMGKDEKAYEMLYELEKNIEELTDEEKAAILWNLAIAFKRVYHYDDELKIWKKVIEEGIDHHFDENKREDIYKRIDELVDYKSGGRFEELKDSEMIEHYSEYLEKIKYFINIGRYGDAEKWLESAGKLKGKDWLYWDFKGKINLLKGNYEEAVKCYREALKTAPDIVPPFDNFKAYLRIKIDFLEFLLGEGDVGKRFLENLDLNLRERNNDARGAVVLFIVSYSIYENKLDMIRKILDKCRDIIDDDKCAEFELATINALMRYGFLDEAEEILGSSQLNYNEKMKNYLGIIDAEIMLYRGRFFEAFDKAYELLTENKKLDEGAKHHIYHILVEALANMGFVDRAKKIAGDMAFDGWLNLYDEVEDAIGIRGFMVDERAPLSEISWDVWNMFFTAEYGFYKINSSELMRDSIDKGGIIGQYGKAVENLINKWIQANLKNANVEYESDEKERLPYIIKDALIGKTTSLGDIVCFFYYCGGKQPDENNKIEGWVCKTLVKELKDEKKREYWDKIKKAFREKFEEQMLIALARNLMPIAKKRNRSVHSQFKNVKQLIDFRKKRRDNFNDILLIISGIESKINKLKSFK